MSSRRPLFALFAAWLCACGSSASSSAPSSSSSPAPAPSSSSAPLSSGPALAPSSSSPGPSSSSSATSAKSAPLIELRPLTISFRGQPIAHLFADGRTESAGNHAPGTRLVPGPTLHADGTIVMTQGGVTARLDDTGHLWVLDPRGGNVREVPFGRIVDDTLLSPEPEHRWRARVHGDMIEFGPDDTSQIEGEVTPAVRHTALVMTAAFLIENAIAPR